MAQIIIVTPSSQKKEFWFLYSFVQKLQLKQGEECQLYCDP